jgi:mRNA interferase MazF
MLDSPPPDRGDVYRVTFRGVGHELQGPHYAVVVTDYPYTQLSTVIVVPFSSAAQAATHRPEATIDGRRTRALIEQASAISRNRLGTFVGSLAGTPIMDEIDEQLRAQLGLEQF